MVNTKDSQNLYSYKEHSKLYLFVNSNMDINKNRWKNSDIMLHVSLVNKHIPVSYTHLDVYKRQYVYSAGQSPLPSLPYHTTTLLTYDVYKKRWGRFRLSHSL